MITIITPSYNSSLFLEKQFTRLETLLCYKIKWIVIDDCSQDETKSVVEAFNSPYVHYKKLSINSGPSIARYEGVKIAETKYVFFLDADDYLYNERFLQFLAFIDTHHADYFYAQTCSSSDINNLPHLNDSINKYIVINKPTDFIFHKMPNYSSLACKKDFFLSMIKPNRLAWGEDIASYLMMANYGGGVKWENPVSCYIITGEGRGSSLCWSKRMALFVFLFRQSFYPSFSASSVIFSLFVTARLTLSFLYKKMGKR